MGPHIIVHKIFNQRSDTKRSDVVNNHIATTKGGKYILRIVLGNRLTFYAFITTIMHEANLLVNLDMLLACLTAILYSG